MNPLKPFDEESARDLRLDAEMVWTGALLEVRFVLTGAVSAVKGLVSQRGEAAEPTEGLWESTCFEAFLGARGRDPYFEINTAADGRWMMFEFSGERVGRVVREDLRPVDFLSTLRQGRFELMVRFDLDAEDKVAGATLMATPAAVLEKNDGTRSYWSLVHGAKPDFHAPAHRVLALKPL